MLAQPFDMLVAVAHQPGLDLVLAVLRKVVRLDHTAPRPNRQSRLDESSWVMSGRTRYVVSAAGSARAPTASRLIF